jgi:alpha-L-fucosidase 2
MGSLHSCLQWAASVLTSDGCGPGIYWTAWTNFRAADPKASVLADLGKVKPYPDVRAAHVADYQGYAGRVSLDLGKSTAAQLATPTAQRLAALNQTFDPQLAALYFQFGRYLFISTSRNGTLPPNLQGLWSEDIDPQWGSKYTININLRRFPPVKVQCLCTCLGPRSMPVQVTDWTWG